MPEEMQRRVGLAIRKRRQDAGYSQEAFADVVGVHRTYMGSVERGERNISLQNLTRIAGALHITLSTLIQEAEQNFAPRASGTARSRRGGR